MPIHDAAYNGSPCALQVFARSAISLAKFAALVSMITWRKRALAARGIVRRLTITASVHELAASKARTSPDPTCPVPPTTKTRKPMLYLSPVTTSGWHHTYGTISRVFDQPYHVNGRRVTWRSTRPASERRFQLPYRRVSRAALLDRR